ncbi:TonB-dependent receptor plug domain-containing protein [Paenimyroides ceti]
MFIHRNILFAIALFGITSVNAQEDKDGQQQDDTVLEEIVISGQYSPQEVNKSIYEVRVINREMIDRLAGNNLADVLNQTLNLNIRPNASTGKSGVEMFGLDAQYFKILVDNVPLVNDESFGSNTDLTQINLDDILQIEIVEGAMGVEYGANAAAGIINIITKKSIPGSWEITPVLQEETIGNEYNLNTKGRHIQSLKIAHQLLDRLYMDATFSRNDFKGHWADRKGEQYALNDSLRGYEWLPKLQQSAKMTMAYTGDNYRIFFKSEYYNEKINKYSEIVSPGYNPETATYQPFSNDEIITTNRYFNLLNASGNANWFKYDVSLSYQQQTRSVEEYKYLIKKDERTNVLKYDFESRKVLYSKGIFSNFVKSDFFDFQIGYEISEMNGFTSFRKGFFDGKNIDRKIGSYDIFGSAEFNITPKFSIRPGMRLLNSNLFDQEIAYSVSAKYILPQGYELRAVYGMSPRLPNYEELYSYYFDANHDIQGNENLTTEKGRSAFLHLKKRFEFNEGSYTNRLSLSLFEVEDRIDLVVASAPGDPLVYRYLNVDTYKNRNISYMGNFRYKNFDAGFGITYGATLKTLNQSEDTNDYLYSMNLNFNVSYKIEKTNTTASLLFKYTGPEYEYVQTGTDIINPTYIRGKRQEISWVDATVRQGFYNNKLDVTVGVRNLFDVTRIRTSSEGAGAHTAGANTLLMGYGRSYFVKLLYKLSI